MRDQPLSDKESIEGATARAKQALKEANADYGIGISSHSCLNFLYFRILLAFGFNGCWPFPESRLPSATLLFRLKFPVVVFVNHCIVCRIGGRYRQTRGHVVPVRLVRRCRP